MINVREIFGTNLVSHSSRGEDTLNVLGTSIIVEKTLGDLDVNDDLLAPYMHSELFDIYATTYSDALLPYFNDKPKAFDRAGEEVDIALLHELIPHIKRNFRKLLFNNMYAIEFLKDTKEFKMISHDGRMLSVDGTLLVPNTETAIFSEREYRQVKDYFSVIIEHSEVSTEFYNNLNNAFHAGDSRLRLTTEPVKERVKVIENARPLFFNLEAKLKVYHLKNLLYDYLTIQKIIEKDVITVSNAQRKDPDEFDEMLQDFSDRVNSKKDFEYLMANKLEVRELLLQLFDNIKFIPNINGNLDSFTELLSDHLETKINFLEKDIDDLQLKILVTLKCPVTYTKLETSKSEINKLTPLFNKRVISIKGAITSSLLDFAHKYISPDITRLDAFDVMPIELVDKSDNAVIETELLQQLVNLMDNVIALKEKMETKEVISLIRSVISTSSPLYEYVNSEDFARLSEEIESTDELEERE
jgi:hypothetical protein